MQFKSLRLTNFLSFGPEAPEIELRNLNVIIGINGSGKSNLIEVFELLRNLPKDLGQTIREGGGVENWLWRFGDGKAVANVVAVLPLEEGGPYLRYELAFTESAHRVEIVDEFIILPDLPIYMLSSTGDATIGSVDAGMGNIPRSQIDPTTSILAQLKDKRTYPELTALGEFFARDIRIYREWGFGRKSLLRQAQSIDLRKDSLEPDCSNLALMMAEAKLNVAYRNDIIDALRLLNPRFNSYEIQVVGRSLEIMIEEEGQFFSAARLSDGTLRFLALAVILCNPNPPKVILIDEPELGLHPDILPQLADMLKKASERCQLIVTTHSEMLVDALSESPEDILVCERKEQGTALTRLDSKELESWLEEYSVGRLWMKGVIGGTRW